MSRREPEPIYAQGFFIVHRSGLFNQIIVFDYYDPDQYYWSVLKNRSRLEKEVKMLAENMQYFLDQEKVLINGVETRPVVKNVEIGVRGKPTISYIVFYIEFEGELLRGLNIYENLYEEEVCEYDYIVYWIFPWDMRVVEADVGVSYNVLNDGRLLIFHVPKGTRVGGYEKIVFEVVEE